jgi:TetR/AcrR family transcriptional regulator
MSQSGSRRGRRHDAEGARETILNAATEVFAAHGFDGARIDAVAAVAGYNKSLIFQYFGDKLGLYVAVIRRADDRTRDMQTRAIALLTEGDAALSPEKVAPLLKRFMGEIFDFYMEHRQMTRIVLWEMAEGWQTYDKIATRLDISDIEMLRPLLSTIKDAGLLRSDFDPMIQIGIAEFMSVLFLACVPLFQMFLPTEGLPSPEAMARGREFIIEFITRGLLTDPRTLMPRRGGT